MLYVSCAWMNKGSLVTTYQPWRTDAGMHDFVWDGPTVAAISCRLVPVNSLKPKGQLSDGAEQANWFTDIAAKCGQYSARGRGGNDGVNVAAWAA